MGRQKGQVSAGTSNTVLGPQGGQSRRVPEVSGMHRRRLEGLLCWSKGPSQVSAHSPPSLAPLFEVGSPPLQLPPGSLNVFRLLFLLGEEWRESGT